MMLISLLKIKKSDQVCSAFPLPAGSPHAPGSPEKPENTVFNATGEIKGLKFLRALLVLVLFIGAGFQNNLIGQTLMPLPAFSNVYSGNVRGYWFVAPANFTITGLKVPADAGTGAQYIQVMKIHDPSIAVYPATSGNFTTLAYISGAPNGVIQTVNIPVNAGDTIGIFGYAAGNNSYSVSTPYTSNINGLPVTLRRLIHQGSIMSAQAPDYSTEATGSISRVEMYYMVNTTPCSGQPTAGTAMGPANICPNIGFALTDTGFTTGSGLVYKWESSPAGLGMWDTIPGANFPYYSVTAGISQPMDYRFTVTCTNGGAVAVSNVISVGINSPLQCYCTPTYTYNCGSGDDIRDVILMGDVAPGISNLNTSCPPGGYADYTSMSAQVSPGMAYNGNVTTNYGSASENVRIWIDYNQDGSFQSTEEIATLSSISNTSTGAFTFTVPPATPDGVYRMRVRLVYNTNPSSIDPCNNYSYGETHDYTINVVTPPPCSGMPVPGTALAPDSVCANVGFSLLDTGYTLGSGIIYQWESSPAGLGIWDTIPGANMPFLNYAAGVSQPTDFRFVVTCTNGGSVDYSNVVTVNLKGFYSCYCSPLNGTALSTYPGDNYITRVEIAGTGLNNSSSAANINGYSQYSSSVPSQTAALIPGVSYTLNVDMQYTYDEAGAWIDFDGDGSFSSSEFIPMTNNNTTGASGTFTVPVTAATGLTGLRMRVNDWGYTYSGTDPCTDDGGGETEDYIVDILSVPPCAGSPVAGTAFAIDSICANVPFVLTDSAFTAGAGIVYQWESSPAGLGIWDTIPGANSNIFNYTAGISQATDFRFVVTCTNGGAVDYSNVITVDVKNFYSCYCSPLNGTVLSSYPGSNYITKVEVVGTGLNNSSSSASALGYTQYNPAVATQTATLLPGVSYTLNIEMYYPQYDEAGAWIDFDGDGNLSSSEFIPMTNNGTTGASGTFTVPVNATMGLTGLRARVNDWGYTYSGSWACTDDGSGETEDYIITIAPPPSCLPPQPVTVLNTLFNTANIEWNQSLSLPANGYEWRVFAQGSGPNGTAIASGTEIAGDTTASVTGLSASTNYTFYIRALCSAMDSSVWSIVNFVTPCSTFVAPFTENFNTSAVPNCWTSTGNGDTWEFSKGSGPDYGVAGSTEHSGNNGYFAWVDGSSPNGTGITLLSPVIDISSLTTPRLRYYVKSYNVDDPQNNRLVVSALDGSTWITIDSVQFNFPTSGWYERAFSLSGVTSATTQIRFVVDEINTVGSSFYNDILIDDIYVENTPTCPTPTLVIDSNATSNSIDLNWTENGTATQWQIEYGPAGFTPGTGTLIPNVTSRPYTLSGLSSGVAYDVYVRSVCAPNDSSAWSIPLMAPTIPDNDSCGFAIDITNGQLYNGYTNVSTQSLAACDATPVANDVWYSFTTGSVSGPVTVTAISTAADLVLQVFSGTCTGTLTALTPTASSAPTLTPCIDGPAAGTEYGTFSVSANTTYLVRVYGFNGSEGTFTIQATGAPLPIRLEGFTALYEESRTRLQWHTSLEARGDYFEVERSLDGIGFERLGTVSGKGSAASYTYYDTHPVRGKNYYRLKLVEASGQSLYSAVREVVVKAGGEFSVRAYPNPVSDVLTVKAYGTEERRGTVTISDVTGKVMEVVPVTDGSVSVQMQGYAAGVYFIKYQDAGHSQTLKVTRR